MKVRITIDCETKLEVLQHIHVINKQVKKLFRKSIPSNKAIVEDANCYGSHVVKLSGLFDDPFTFPEPKQKGNGDPDLPF